MSKAKIDKKTQAALERLHAERMRLEARALRAMNEPKEVARSNLKHIIESTTGDLTKDWTITSHAQALPALKQEARKLGMDLSSNAAQTAQLAIKLAMVHWVKTWRLFAHQATGRTKPPVPNVDPQAVLSDATTVTKARTADVGAPMGESVGQTIAAASLLKTMQPTSAAGAAQAVAEALEARVGQDIERVIITEVTAGYSAGMTAMTIHVERRVPEIRKIWDATLDRKVCRRCAPMHHMHVPVNEPWPNGIMAPPAHPRCRCAAMPWMEEWSTVLEELEIAPGPRTGFAQDTTNEWWDRPF